MFTTVLLIISEIWRKTMFITGKNDKVYGLYVQWNIIQPCKEGNPAQGNNMDGP